MKKQFKFLFITFVGGVLVIVGTIFIVLPGPAFLFLPIGLAVLSVEHEWAKPWLKRCQRWMRIGAVKADRFLRKIKSKLNLI